MKRSIWLSAAGLLALSTFSPISRAADHRDWPGYQQDIASDITDVYSWMSADGSKVYLALDVQGANTGALATTKFSDAVQYVIHVSSSSAYGQAQTADSIICKFDTGTPQNFQCWGPGASGAATEYVKDAVGNTAGKTSTSGKMKVFAGVRDDPFFFNIRGFAAAGAAIHAAAIKTGTGALTFNAAKCPTNIDSTTSMAIVNTLKSNGTPPTPGTDDFGKNGNSLLPPGTGGTTNGNILAIVISIDKTLLTTGGPMLSVWASTNR